MPKRTLLMSDGPHFEPGCNIYEAELTKLVMFGGDMLIFGDDIVLVPVGDDFLGCIDSDPLSLGNFWTVSRV